MTNSVKFMQQTSSPVVSVVNITYCTPPT